MTRECITIKGARQNNLKGFDLDLPLNELIVVTGVSGSGKSSLAFHTIYAEGQRRYVETFSPYARQFLDRMDKPRADRIDGIPPAIAIDQTNPVRTSRSTVGTMTELNDYLKLLFARAGQLHCRACGRPVRRDTADGICAQVADALGTSSAPEVLVTFEVTVPENFSEQEVQALLAKQGYTRILKREKRRIEVIQDRVRVAPGRSARLTEDIEAALKHGGGRVALYPLGPDGTPGAPLRFSSGLHCADCDIHYRDPTPNLFSFNSPIGACDACRGFGRTIGIDYGLVIPDDRLSLGAGAIRPWQTESYKECQDDLRRFARRKGVPMDVPWSKLTAAQQRWVIEGEGPWENHVWYGVKRFFEWLEGRSYRMHIRVLLSKYRTYRLCPACNGARLKPDALLYRVGDKTLHDIVLLPIDRGLAFFRGLQLPAPLDEATELLLSEVRTRLGYLAEVGLGYLSLDRQSRTLSGGEVQRINLTTALGTSLVNTLFVLDEPSIGLHPRDIRRLIGVLHRLRDAGNTLIVVEHDPDVIRAADRVIDMGPGPGEQGGQVVFNGTLPQLLRSARSLTAQYLRGEKRVGGGRGGSVGVCEYGSKREDQPPQAYTPAHTHTLTHPHTHTLPSPTLSLLGAAEHNLKNIDVHIPLSRLVCITGVSGSGKSTLVQDILYPALRKAKHKPSEAAGRHAGLEGHEHVDDAVLVNQSPIGKTARSTPASYVGAFDAIRDLFARESQARERGYTAGTFSFNAGTGRCPACNGSGFEHVEMQFLSDVYLRCQDCNGRRYRPEALEVKRRGRSVADVLEMTVNEATLFFADEREVLYGLDPLRAVGLGYLTLGQPVPTLSGGEAQRLKLAGHLADTRRGGPRRSRLLFLFDEPTTGLHFDDIATLLRALRELMQEGHSVIVIEHNLDVIRAADWIVDLGPEGGDAGGEVVCVGTPAEVMRCERSHTGTALRAAEGRGSGVEERRAPPPSSLAPRPSASIRIHHAREHNLKNIDIAIPRDKFTVITGISGSGKSTLAFDILFAEGQRRYLESLNAYARQFVQPASRPDVEAVFGIPPTVAIEQRTSRGGRKSTVATVTEIYHFLRLLFVKLGTQNCPDCNLPIEPQTVDAILARVMRKWRGQRIAVLAPLVTARKGYYTDLAKWAKARGFDNLRVDGAPAPTDQWPRLSRFREHDIELPLGEFLAQPRHEPRLRAALEQALEHGHGVLHILSAEQLWRPDRPTVFSTRRACPGCGRSFEEPDPRLFSFNSRHGWCPRCYGTGLLMEGFDEEQTGEEIWWNAWWEGGERNCPACEGRRLRPEALSVLFRKRTISEMADMPVTEAEDFFRRLRLSGREGEIARDLVAEIRSRLAFLREVGLPYLALGRAAPTLSGGEAQRIRLAAQLGSNLRGVCYILDEPTIGLHARDNLRLLHTLRGLEDKGNTVVVVEHDEETIRHAEHIIDLGPGAGADGGRVVAQGTLRDILRCAKSVTGRRLREPPRHAAALRRPSPGPLDAALRIVGASLHNLRCPEVRIPLRRLVCVTGVSGSGKSTLVKNVLYENVRRLVARVKQPPAGCRAVAGTEHIRQVLEVDQTPIGKTPRSCPATYVGFWNAIRRLFAESPEARLRGYTASRFSFNVPGGRCEVCEGQGLKRIEMSFLPDVTVACEACGGRRFSPETLNARYRERTIADVLAMSVDEAEPFFAAHAAVHRALRLLQDVGLGYLTLGQQSPTLSGGEAQRIKLVTELAKTRNDERRTMNAETDEPARPGTLYVLDEPTIGLHMADVDKLVRVLHRLVDAGNTVVMIEHNLDVIAEADWIIDLGPEGGAQGGRIVAQGPPERVARRGKQSHTAQFLKRFLAGQNG